MTVNIFSFTCEKLRLCPKKFYFFILHKFHERVKDIEKVFSRQTEKSFSFVTSFQVTSKQDNFGASYRLVVIFGVHYKMLFPFGGSGGRCVQTFRNKSMARKYLANTLMFQIE